MEIETGQGLPTADSYASPEEAGIYNAARGITAWVLATDAAQAAALVQATDYIEALYRAHSVPLTLGQALQFPTFADGLPSRVKRATIVLALDALSGPLAVRATRGIKQENKSLDGVGSTSVTYDDAGPSDPFPHVTAILAPVASLRSAGGDSVVIGRVTR